MLEVYQLKTPRRVGINQLYEQLNSSIKVGHKSKPSSHSEIGRSTSASPKKDGSNMGAGLPMNIP
jgi:hypothetical protein